MKTEAEIEVEMMKRAELIGVGAGFRSDYFALLAHLLAYYKVRGTEPEDMLSPTMRATIDRIIGSEQRPVSSPTPSQ